MDAIGLTASFEGAETVTFGDYAMTEVDSTYGTVTEEGDCPVTCEGGYIAGDGCTVITTEQTQPSLAILGFDLLGSWVPPAGSPPRCEDSEDP